MDDKHFSCFVQYILGLSPQRIPGSLRWVHNFATKYLQHIWDDLKFCLYYYLFIKKILQKDSSNFATKCLQHIWDDLKLCHFIIYLLNFFYRKSRVHLGWLGSPKKGS